MPQRLGIIPARYQSSRFPGKPLADILGRPMFWHVWTRARRCPLLDRVVLATDDERIRRAAEELGVEALMTSPDHASGSDRVLEAADRLGATDDAVVVNIQGDEPALDPALITALLEPFADPAVRVTTPAAPLTAEEAQSPDRVKVVWTQARDALYFSRSAIPHGRDADQPPSYWGHVGVYAFRLETLRLFSRLPQSPLERLEKLEQLRLLEAGIPIRVVPGTYRGHGVDRPEDIAAVAALMNA